MKSAFGLFAAIAAVAGIASAISKNEEKAENEFEQQRLREQQLELEQQRLNIAAEQNERRQRMQERRQQLEEERWLMEQERWQKEQEQKEYQRRLANAPQKAVYKKIESLLCPRCMGHREIDESEGIVKCPFCEYVEQLDVERYEVDLEAFEQQLQEEKVLRARQLLEEKEREEAEWAVIVRNGKYNDAIRLFGFLSIVFLIILFFSPFIGTALFLPTLLILCVLLYRRFPEKGSKVWNAIKLPLACIFIFPIPLTALFMNSERLETKYPKAARIGMSIGTWIIYGALICVLGVFYVKGFQNEIHPDQHKQAEAIANTTAIHTTQTQNENNAGTATQATENPTGTNTKVEIPSSEKKRVNYYNSEKKNLFSFGGLEFNIPEMWKEQEKYNTDSIRVFFDTSDSVYIGELIFESFDFSENGLTNDYFRNTKDSIVEKIIKNYVTFNTANSKKNNITIDGHDGIYAAVVGDLDTENPLTVELHTAIVFDETTHTLVSICLIEKYDAGMTYWNDYNSIIINARFADTNKNESTNTETNIIMESTATTVDLKLTTEPEPEIYPQEDAFRAAVVAITNALATDVFTSDGSRHDTSKYHSYSDTSTFYMSVLAKGTWTEKNSNTWHVEGLRLQPDGYDTVYNTPINFDTVAKVALDVTFDGNNYIISNISGMYAIPGKEDIGTNLSYLNSDSMSKSALTVSPEMIKNSR